MKNLFIAGNWKSNKTVTESLAWIETQALVSEVTSDQWKFLTVVILPPFTALESFKEQIRKRSLPFVIGAQDISPFPDGPYTGQVSGRMLTELVEWVIIGHSERRKYFNETEKILEAKVSEAKKSGLKIIYCVPDDKTPVPQGVDVVAYEPVWAIGTGKTDTPENANAVITSIKTKTKVQTVIYGGSVTQDNVATFVAASSIDGVLPGGASLDPQKFTSLVIHAASSNS